MRWWRRHCEFGARIALFALILQLALSFGHVHALPSGEAAVAPIATASGPAGDQDHDDDYCAICAVLALLSGSQTAAAPAVAIPVAYTIAAAPIAAATVRPIEHRISFRSRAPPLS